MNNLFEEDYLEKVKSTSNIFNEQKDTLATRKKKLEDSIDFYIHLTTGDFEKVRKKVYKIVDERINEWKKEAE